MYINESFKLNKLKKKKKKEYNIIPIATLIKY